MPTDNKKTIVAVILSVVLHYVYLNEFFTHNISTSIDIHMILFICVTYYIYVIISLILDRKLSTKDGYALRFLYIIFLVTMFFSKDVNTSAGYINTFNLDVTGIAYSLNSTIGILFIVMNVLLLIPIGWMCRKMDPIIRILFPLLLFLVIEYIQYSNEVGIFDINDIILNTLGFYIGTFIFARIG